jgi:hypothetical protein
MDFFRRLTGKLKKKNNFNITKRKSTVRSNFTRRKPFQDTRNWFTNLKSSFKNYFAKKRFVKEGRNENNFHPTQTAKESREKMERFGRYKPASQRVTSNTNLTENNENNENTINVEEVITPKIKSGNTNVNRGNFETKNALKPIKTNIETVKDAIKELKVFERRLEETKFFFDKQEVVKKNTEMLEELIRGSEVLLEEANKQLHEVAFKKGAKPLPKFRHQEAGRLRNEVGDLQDQLHRMHKRLDAIYEYSENMARQNIQLARRMVRSGEVPNIKKALKHIIKVKGVNEGMQNEDVLGYFNNVGALEEKLKRKTRANRVQTMRRRGGSTRKLKH